MNLRYNSLAALSLICVAGLGLAATNHWDDEQEIKSEIKLADLPEAARASVTKTAPANSIQKITKETDGGVTAYEIEYTDAGVICFMDVSPAGDVLMTERVIGQDKLPAAVNAALKLGFPGATITDANIVVTTYYKVNVVIDGKTHEVKMDAAGNIEDEDDGENGSADDDADDDQDDIQDDGEDVGEEDGEEDGE